MVRRLGLGKNNHLTYNSLALNPRYIHWFLKNVQRTKPMHWTDCTNAQASHILSVFTYPDWDIGKQWRPRSDSTERRTQHLISACTVCLNYRKLRIKWNRLTSPFRGLGGSVGCAVRLETRRSRVQHPPRSATFFRGDWSWNIFYGHSLPSAVSRRAVVSFWRKNVHNTG